MKDLRSRYAALIYLLCVFSLILALTGCQITQAGTPQTGSSQNALAVSNSSLSTSAVVGGSSVLTDTISNLTSASVTITGAVVTGAGIQVTQPQFPYTLAAGGSIALSVRYAPSAVGSTQGTITLASNTSNPSTTISFTGTAVKPGQLAVTPASISFGSVLVGKSQTVSGTLTNPGGSNLTISQFSASGTVFTISGPTLPATLAPSQSVSFTVTFTPKQSGTVSGNVAVVNAASLLAPGQTQSSSGATTTSNTTTTVSVSGTGMVAGQLVAAPASLNFGSVQAGGSQTLAETLTNSGNTTVKISQATVSGTGFSVAGLALPLTLTAGQSANFNITYKPQTTGSSNGSVAITSDASNSTLNILLSGTEAAPGALTLSLANLPFGSVPTGSSQKQSVTLTNTGGSSVNLTQASVTGSGFSLSGLTVPATLSAGQAISFSVTFAPQSTGNVTGSVAIASNATNSSLTLPLSGTGIAPGTLTANPSSLNFGTVQVGSSQTLSGTLTNSGGSSISITQASASGTGFTVSGLTLPLTLSAGQSATFSAVFRPQTSGTASGSLSISSNASNATLTIPFSGTAVTQGTLAASSSTLSFGNVLVGNNQSLPETLTNSGGSSISITQATPSGAGFSISGLSLPLTLAAGKSTMFNVVFAPQSAGSRTGSIVIASNASNSSLSISTSGAGITPGAVSPSPSTVDFGSVQTGNSKLLSETLTNSGGSNMTVSQATVSGAGFSISGLTLPLTLTPGQSFTFGITFAPQTSGSATGSLVISSGTTLSIPLSGTGTVLSQLTVSPATLSFGSVTVGSSKAATATLTASGSSVTVSSITPSTTEFSVSGLTLPVAIAAGQSVSFTVTFTPQSSGNASASLSVASNASNSPTTQALAGTGVAATPVQHSVNLSWTASTSAVAGYNVYRRTSLTASYSKLNSTLNATATYTDSSVQSGQTYYYSTTAVDANGNESIHSNEIQVVVPTP